MLTIFVAFIAVLLAVPFWPVTVFLALAAGAIGLVLLLGFALLAFVLSFPDITRDAVVAAVAVWVLAEVVKWFTRTAPADRRDVIRRVLVTTGRLILLVSVMLGGPVVFAIAFAVPVVALEQYHHGLGAIAFDLLVSGLVIWALIYILRAGFGVSRKNDT